ncbi:hypothetical protein KKB40_01240 [Patescibacteria group bacterium]|nr:hypothetical protein [Patescibacteria group bacterium]
MAKKETIAYSTNDGGRTRLIVGKDGSLKLGHVDPGSGSVDFERNQIPPGFYTSKRFRLGNPPISLREASPEEQVDWLAKHIRNRR